MECLDSMPDPGPFSKCFRRRDLFHGTPGSIQRRVFTFPTRRVKIQGLMANDQSVINFGSP